MILRNRRTSGIDTIAEGYNLGLLYIFPEILLVCVWRVLQHIETGQHIETRTVEHILQSYSWSSWPNCVSDTETGLGTHVALPIPAPLESLRNSSASGSATIDKPAPTRLGSRYGFL